MSKEQEAAGAEEDARRPDDALEVREAADAEPDESKSAPEDRAESGPFDASEVPSMRPYVDLGGVKVAPREGLQLRLEVDERANRVVAVSLEYAESLLQVQAFAAPKTTGLWHRVRGELVQQFSAQGAAVTEEDGALGPELVVVSQAPAEQGGGTRTVRFVAVDGPRWMVRGVVMGKAAVDAAARERVIDLFRELVVVRGEQPMPPSELLPLRVPAGVQAQRQGAPAPDAQQA
ncbi:DUF3710 domain-containing protein [Leucobacter allii]|uniref:DUF3710 domain-containing protein n=1 Tax=Leucobacter allii TaxID=2932247 RepID=A0ABY4FR11_9MICO|nr:DUF3710 domain-containing protein [Leucobacter allii]UOQ58614.1 DUF3710 domain-containing protein [Leucobacter allii]UOR03143.1 DUF3710 domain-containing protein [Leucobacter allii]